MVSAALIITLIALLFLKAPVIIAMGASAAVGCVLSDMPMYLIAQGVVDGAMAWNLLALFFFLNKTKLGLSMQAISQNKELALMTGVNVKSAVFREKRECRIAYRCYCLCYGQSLHGCACACASTAALVSASCTASAAALISARSAAGAAALVSARSAAAAGRLTSSA